MRQGERLVRLAARLGAGGTVTIGIICEEYGVSLATAKRDFVVLEQALPVTKEPIPGNDNPCPPKQLRIPREHEHEIA